MNRLFLLLFGMVTFVAHAQVPDYVPTEGLVAWYPFNGNANDESGNGHDGEVIGATGHEDRFNQAASSFNFDPSELSFIATDINLITGDDDRSFSFWVRVDEGREGDYVLSLGPAGAAAAASCNSGFHIEVGLNDCQFVGLGVGANCYQRREPFDQLHNNTWHHLVITYSGAGLDQSHFWIDGVLQSQTGCLDGYFPDSLNTSASLEMSIGRRNDGNLNSYFDGLIDDVGVWNRALTEEEILALYNAPAPAPGCTDSSACNYNEEANEDDGSCTYPPFGLADCESGGALCGEGTIWDASLQACVGFNDCPSDLDGDGLIGVEDLLSLLSDFGTDCVASDDPESAEWACGDPVSYHGYDYATVQIGEQCWFAENLRTEHYRNQDSIATSLSNVEWAETTNGAQTILNNNFENLSIYGRLYNWYAVSDNRELCPIDWHVPVDEEWIWLSEYLGGSGIAGEHLKTEYGWYAAGNGDNSSGFNGLPGGTRNQAGNFQYGSGDHGLWWSSSLVGISAWGQYLVYSHPNIFGNVYGRNAGFSVRCIKD